MTKKSPLKIITWIIKKIGSIYVKLVKLCALLKDMPYKIKQIETTLDSMEQQILHSSQQINYLTRQELLKNHNPSLSETQLMLNRVSVYSQNGEDGIILELIRRIGNPTHKFIEICCGDNGGNSGFLAFELGWSGLMIDGNPLRIEKLRNNFQIDPQKVTILNSWVTCENINKIIKDSNMTGNTDLLSIDLDGNDYWIWKEINSSSPYIVIIEYNASFGHEKSVTVPYKTDFARPANFRLYYGASLMALYRLGKEKGYRLIGVEPNGVNAIFLRNDLLQDTCAEVHPSTCYKMLNNHLLYKNKKGFADFYEELKRQELPVIEI